MLCEKCEIYRFPSLARSKRSKVDHTLSSNNVPCESESVSASSKECGHGSGSSTVTYQTRSKQYEDTNATVSSEALSKSEEGVTGGQRSKSQNRNRPVRSESLVDAAKENTAGLNTPDITAPPVNGGGSVVLNNLLMYAIFQRNRCTAASLRAVINDFYSPNEISDAKKQLSV